MLNIVLIELSNIFFAFFGIGLHIYRKAIFAGVCGIALNWLGLMGLMAYLMMMMAFCAAKQAEPDPRATMPIMTEHALHCHNKKAEHLLPNMPAMLNHWYCLIVLLTWISAMHIITQCYGYIIIKCLILLCFTITGGWLCFLWPHAPRMARLTY